MNPLEMHIGNVERWVIQNDWKYTGNEKSPKLGRRHKKKDNMKITGGFFILVRRYFKEGLC